MIDINDLGNNSQFQFLVSGAEISLISTTEEYSPWDKSTLNLT